MNWWMWIVIAAGIGAGIGWLLAGVGKGADKVAQEDPAAGDHE